MIYSLKLDLECVEKEFFHLRGQVFMVHHSMHWPKGKEAT